jgi:hypothetical protein
MLGLVQKGTLRRSMARNRTVEGKRNRRDSLFFVRRRHND